MTRAKCFHKSEERHTRWLNLAAWSAMSAFGIATLLLPQLPDRAALATSLRQAACAGDLLRLRSALAAGAAVDAPDNVEVTALIEATRAGHTDVVNQLIRAGANVNRVHPVLGTPLMQAVLNGRPDVLQLLLAHGADPNLCNEAGTSALIYAINAQDHRMVSILLDAGAAVSPDAQNSDRCDPPVVVENSSQYH